MGMLLHGLRVCLWFGKTCMCVCVCACVRVLMHVSNKTLPQHDEKGIWAYIACMVYELWRVGIARVGICLLMLVGLN